MGFSTLIVTCHFPMWGSMFFPPRASALVSDVITPEEKYYTREVRCHAIGAVAPPAQRLPAWFSVA